MPNLTLCLETEQAPAWANDLLRLADTFDEAWLLRELGAPLAVGVRLVGEIEARGLNQDFRQQDYVPDVLSFPTEDSEAWDEEEDWNYLGDIALTVSVVEAEAAARGWPTSEMARHLVVHGLLHVMGHDHDNDAARVAMEDAEAAWLAAAGDPNPYERTL